MRSDAVEGADFHRMQFGYLIRNCFCVIWTSSVG